MKLSVPRTTYWLASASALLLAMATTPAWAQISASYCPSFLAVDGAAAPAHRGEITFSPYTHHWKHSAEHKPVVLLSVDKQLPGERFCGVRLFSNSFGQPSIYIYAGQRFNRLLGVPQLFVKVTAGILYGYVEPYENKVPLNQNGFSPAIIPSVGYQLTPKDSVQVQILGSAGLMLSYGRKF
jgi:hypothetical protein